MRGNSHVRFLEGKAPVRGLTYSTIGRFYSYWEGNEWTALYFYGVSFVEMKQKIEPFIASYPLCQKSRIEQIA